jgi:hypothetical protein
MSLHIFLGDEMLLYFIVRVELIEIQIWFEFKLICNLQKCLKKLQKGLKNYKGFSRQYGLNLSRPSLAFLPSCLARPA